MSENSVDAVAIIEQRLARDGVTIDQEERDRLIVARAGGAGVGATDQHPRDALRRASPDPSADVALLRDQDARICLADPSASLS